MTSDETLMLEFQRGSREALEELFARYRQPLFGFFRRRLANKERAEDLAQETFVAVIRAAARYEPRSMVCTYLYGIALRLLANERRKQAKDWRKQDEDPPSPGTPDKDRDSRVQGAAATLDAIPDPKAAGAADTVLWVRQALEKLEPAEREVLMLREYEQLSYEGHRPALANSHQHRAFAAVSRAHGIERPSATRRGDGQGREEREGCGFSRPSQSKSGGERGLM
jgi:RNA polymerase sigma-70 factor (ECF subfamily)